MEKRPKIKIQKSKIYFETTRQEIINRQMVKKYSLSFIQQSKTYSYTKTVKPPHIDYRSMYFCFSMSALRNIIR